MSETNRPTIIVGYDRSDASRAAVELAAKRAATGAHLVIVHTSEQPGEYVGTPYYQHMLDDAVTRSREAMAALERTCPGLADADYETDCLSGDPARVILDVAELRQASEIIIGSRGLGRFRSFVLGSVAQKVIHGATCPVLVVPEHMLGAQPAAGAARASAFS